MEVLNLEIFHLVPEHEYQILLLEETSDMDLLLDPPDPQSLYLILRENKCSNNGSLPLPSYQKLWHSHKVEWKIRM